MNVNLLYGQSTFNPFGNNSILLPNFRLNTLEMNTQNYSPASDWEIGFAVGLYNSPAIAGNLSLISISKKISDHYFYLRYTPGFQKAFSFRSGTQILVSNSQQVESELKTRIDYNDNFGLGYAYNISGNLSAGLSVRYLNQKTQNDIPVLVSDTVSYIIAETEELERKYWIGDIGIMYNLKNKIALGIQTKNMIVSIDESGAVDGNNYSLRTPKGAAFYFDYLPAENVSLNGIFETDLALSLGTVFSFDFYNGSLSFGCNLLHDKYQSPFINSVSPSINYSSNLFSVTLSGVKYFTGRKGNLDLNKFIVERIENVNNNRFSYDRAYLSINIALSFKSEQRLKILEAEILKEIHPTLVDTYLYEPFAKAQVINLTGEKLRVIPSAKIDLINDGFVQSQSVVANAHDTVYVPFYISIPEDAEIKKRDIYQVRLLIASGKTENDDEIQKSILVNDRNSWDGNVRNLKYFVSSSYSLSRKIVSEYLKVNKGKISDDRRLDIFEKTKKIFDEFIKQMTYVSDPRATKEYVQFPLQTIQLKGGDCDDLSVAFASFLESIGIQTAFVDYKNSEAVNHVNVMVNLELKPVEASLITKNDKKYFLRKNSKGEDEIWLPLEMTSLTDFETAWELGSAKFYKEAISGMGLIKGDVEIIDIY
ncbi:MAG: transglutaminase-like domain-containing protein [Melioribacteraceae bacterium]|nr:transglutaminase-like domain-containing protein [Melioribacteraceae bacterium]MCF8355278.1 transglutaminase-like domain-containing protein [Melioribacteraceae bacterium]MCF8394124.1 transglutaminase-like domain-containing protein [Melioribacteraceae bacterium]MCF8418137.1 transglutaminase-like domain-containing protein [Melioribacteraceae bacterium]